MALVLVLTISAVSSLWTTTFSVLEYYYMAMLAYSDQKAAHAEAEGLMSSGGVAEAAWREKLAQDVDAAVVSFGTMRASARNNLWISVMTLLGAMA